MQQKRLDLLGRPGGYIDDWSFYGYGEKSVMKIKCNTCKQAVPDNKNARWSIIDKDFYVLEKYKRHKCDKGSNASMVPQNEQTPYTNINSLKNPQWAQRYITWQRLIRKKEDTKGLATQVTSWCIECKKETVLHQKHGGGNMLIDKEPQWSIGTPAKYLERGTLCLNCKKPTNRMIPVDLRIPSITKEVLTNNSREFAKLNDEDLAIVIQSIAPASRHKRLLKRPAKRTCQQMENIE